MTVRQAMPLLWKYLAVVATSCLLAFVISTQASANTQQPPKVASIAPVAADASAGAYASAGPFTVQVIEETWRDAARGRDVPLRIYTPAADTAPKEKLAVVLFSHGLGGNRAGGKAWGEHWASHGYISVHMQHAGSDESLWRNRKTAEVEGQLKGAMTITNLALRVGDVHYVLDEIGRRAKGEAWPLSRADTSRIGMSGHSFGAGTTLAVTGQANPASGGQAGLDKRLKAAIAFSPLARNKKALDKQFGDIKLPFFSITGSLDGEVLNDGTKPADRELPFKSMAPGDKYLLVFDGGDHMVFGGHTLGGRRPKTARDEEIQMDVKAASLAFWNAYLRGDKAALAWLSANDDRSSLKSVLTANDRFELR